jgi:hypothetical protein
MIWEVAPEADLVRPPCSYELSVRQVAAALQRSYKSSSKLQGLVDELIDKVRQNVLPEYQNKTSVSDDDLLTALGQEFGVFKIWHAHSLYEDLNALAGLLASDFVLWVMPIDKMPRLWGSLWKYCAGALDLFLLYELRSWWNGQANVRKVSEQLYRKVEASSGREQEFVTIRMTEAKSKLPYESQILRDLTKHHLEILVQEQRAETASSLEQLLRKFLPSSDNLSRDTLQKVYGETPSLLVVNVNRMVDLLEQRGPIANLLKAVVDWAVYNNVKAVIQHGEVELFTETQAPLDPTGTKPGKKPQLDPNVTKPGRGLHRSFSIGFRIT